MVPLGEDLEVEIELDVELDVFILDLLDCWTARFGVKALMDSGSTSQLRESRGSLCSCLNGTGRCCSYQAPNLQDLKCHTNLSVNHGWEDGTQVETLMRQAGRVCDGAGHVLSHH